MSAFPWHLDASPVYHDEERCPLNAIVDPDKRLPGTAGKRRCGHCQNHEGHRLRRSLRSRQK